MQDVCPPLCSKLHVEAWIHRLTLAPSCGVYQFTAGMRSEERQGRCKHPGLFSRNVKWKYDDSKKLKEIVQLKWKKESIKLCVCVCVILWHITHSVRGWNVAFWPEPQRGEQFTVTKVSLVKHESLSWQQGLSSTGPSCLRRYKIRLNDDGRYVQRWGRWLSLSPTIFCRVRGYLCRCFWL